MNELYNLICLSHDDAAFFGQNRHNFVVFLAHFQRRIAERIFEVRVGVEFDQKLQKLEFGLPIVLVNDKALRACVLFILLLLLLFVFQPNPTQPNPTQPNPTQPAE